MKKWLFILLSAGVLFLAGMFLIYYKVQHDAAPYIFDKVEEVPRSKVAVLLGTSSYLTDGSKNLYFEYRMDAATELYESGRVEYILVSGDNRQKSYNEPLAMQRSLLKRGVPENKIVLDYAGFRTFDSMIRAKEVFGQSEFTVVSQRFHNERAVYIARQNDIKAHGYNALDVEVSAGLKTKLREVLARAKMILDLYVLNTEPHFLGEKVLIGE